MASRLVLGHNQLAGQSAAVKITDRSDYELEVVNLR